MTKFPFQILVEDLSKNKEESLTCLSLLRAVSGKRYVYDALWNDRKVIAKVFLHKFSAKRHLKREWRGLNLLQNRGLNSPQPLFFGRTRTGQWVLATEKIVDSSTVSDAFYKMRDYAGKLKLLILMCREVARQHGRGVLQTDLHMSNFLLAGNDVLTIDVAQIRFYRRRIPRRRCISQLAMLCCFSAKDDSESIRTLYEEYARCRGWCLRKSDQRAFQRYQALHKKAYVRRGLKKSLRTSARHLRIKCGKYLAVYDRSFCDGAEAPEFHGHIESLMDEGEIIKNDKTSCISLLNWNGRDVVVKGYNSKGLLHSVGHTIWRSRARRDWLLANSLKILKTPAATPLAFIEERKWIFIWKSYFVQEFTDEKDFQHSLQNKQSS